VSISSKAYHVSFVTDIRTRQWKKPTPRKDIEKHGSDWDCKQNIVIENQLCSKINTNQSDASNIHPRSSAKKIHLVD
jgi:hypothetical protein